LALVRWNVATRNTDEKLYRSALRYPTTVTMESNLAIVLLRQHRLAEALPYLESVCAADPTKSNACGARDLVQQRLQNQRPAR
jgi:hypothetical protein